MLGAALLSMGLGLECAGRCGVGGEMQNSKIMRDSTAARGFKQVCEGRAGGPQGSALTCIVFPILLDGVLKETERRFPGVETKAIQDDVDLYGDPAIILGEGGALGQVRSWQKTVCPPR